MLQRGRKSKALLAMVANNPHLIPSALPPGLPQPPNNLAQEEKEIWCNVIRQCPPAAVSLLECALHMRQSSRHAREIINADGMVTTNKRGQPRPHPLLRHE